jgi:hypothetical protein
MNAMMVALKQSKDLFFIYMISFRIKCVVIILKIKKPFKPIRLEGLHPVFLTLLNAIISVNRRKVTYAKAGLLTPPPVQRPSHFVSTKQ